MNTKQTCDEAVVVVAKKMCQGEVETIGNVLCVNCIQSRRRPFIGRVCVQVSLPERDTWRGRKN